MKMDQRSFQAVEQRDHGRIAHRQPLGIVRIVVGALLFPIIALLTISFAALMLAWALVELAARLVRECVIYSAEVTIGRPRNPGAQALR